jgi:hypothetical protein
MPINTPAWPESPMVYGYLTLDERGQWLIRGQTISRPSLVEHFQRHYQSDGAGRWFVKNGWQQAFVTLDYLPRVLRVTGRGDLIDHCQRPIDRVAGAVLDETGALILDTPDGPGLVDSSDLAWALERLQIEGGALTDDRLSDALQIVSGEMTALTFSTPAGNTVPVRRVDRTHMARHFSFVPNPRPEPRTTKSGQ